jgi:hypothetical protein
MSSYTANGIPIQHFWNKQAVSTATVIQYLIIDTSLDWAMQLQSPGSPDGTTTISVCLDYVPNVTNMAAPEVAGTWTDVTTKLNGGAITLSSTPTYISVPRGTLVSPYVKLEYTGGTVTTTADGYLFKTLPTH